MKRELTKEQREAIGARLKAGRERKAAEQPHDGMGELREAAPKFTDITDALAVINPEWLAGNVRDDFLRPLGEALTTALEHVAKRIQIMEERRKQGTCSICNGPFPNGRHIGEIVVRDKVTNEQIPLRACSFACYREIEGIARTRSAESVSNQRGSVAL